MCHEGFRVISFISNKKHYHHEINLNIYTVGIRYAEVSNILCFKMSVLFNKEQDDFSKMNLLPK